MSLFDNFRAVTGLFAPDDDEGAATDDFNPEPSDINLVDADKAPEPQGDAESSQLPPAQAASSLGTEL